MYIFFTVTDLPSHPYNIEEVAVEGRSTTSSSGLCQVSKFLDGFELGSPYFVNFEELRLKMVILKMKIALLSLKKLKIALCAGTPTEVPVM